MRQTAYIGLLAGLGCFTGLIAYHGIAEVAAALAAAGWGLVVVAAYHVVPMLINTMAWKRLLNHAGERATMGFLLRARWLSESINALLPVAQVGGDFVKARLAIRRGICAPVAGASVMVDFTLSVFAQVVFTLLGLALLLGLSDHGELVAATLLGAAVVGALVGTFYLVQRKGMFVALGRLLEKAFEGRDWAALIGSAAAIDAAATAYYERRRLLLAAAGWRLLGWCSGTGEVWLAMHFLGAPVSLPEAFLLESLGQAIRAAAFVVPAALGVQEGGFLLLGSLLGLMPESALALSLCKRVRELLLGVPGLIVWQVSASRQVLAQKREKRDSERMTALPRTEEDAS